MATASTHPAPFTPPRQCTLPGCGDIGNRAEPMRHEEEEILRAALVVITHGEPGTGIGRLLLVVFPGVPEELARRRRIARDGLQ